MYVDELRGTDEDLVRQLQQGDRGAMNGLVERYERRLFGWLCRHLDQHDARDVLQDIWIRVMNTIDAFQADKGKLFPWLVYRMRSCLSDHLRRRRNRPEVPLSHYLATAEDKGSEPGPQAVVLRSEEWDLLHGQLEQLPAEKRQVLFLWFFVGLSGKEIAERLQIPEATVHSRKLAALRKLRSLLEGSNP